MGDVNGELENGMLWAVWKCVDAESCEMREREIGNFVSFFGKYIGPNAWADPSDMLRRLRRIGEEYRSWVWQVRIFEYPHEEVCRSHLIAVHGREFARWNERVREFVASVLWSRNCGPTPVDGHDEEMPENESDASSDSKDSIMTGDWWDREEREIHGDDGKK